MKAKRLLAVLVAVCILLTSLAGIAFAAEGEYTCSNVSFGYVSGDTWTDAEGLEAGKDLSAKISVSKTGNKESVVFSLIVYSEDKIYDVNTVTEEVDSEGTVITAKASLPDDVEDCYVSAFLWDNYVNMTPICNISGFPDASVAVTAISVDGVEIPNFDPAVKTYDVAVDEEKILMPVVEVKTLDLGAKVEITNPTRFPGKSVVKVTNGSGDENVYTLNYTFEKGLVYDIDYTQNVYDNVDGALVKPTLNRDLQVGSKAFYCRDGVNDSRTSFVTAINDESILGLDYIGAGIAWKNSPPYRDYYATAPEEWLQFTIGRDAKVMIVMDGLNDALPKLGFEHTTSTNIMQATVNATTTYKYSNVYTKSFSKGDVVKLPASKNANGLFILFEFGGYKESLVPGAELTGVEIASKPNKLTYRIDEEVDLTGLTVNAVHSNGVKVEITDYEVEVPQLAIGTNTVTVSYAGFSATFDIEVEGINFGLSDLKVDGEAVEGFDIAKQEYTVTISANKKNIPVVDATPTEGGTATVVDPTEFPGKATVTVTKDGEEDMVYTINYVLDKAKVTDLSILGDNTIPESYGGGKVVALPEYTEKGFVTGAYAYADRKDRVENFTRYSVLEITDDRLVGGDYIIGNVTWYNGTTPTVKAYTGSEDLDWMQFTVNRDATVYVLKYKEMGEEKLLSRGFTKSTSSDSLGYMHTLLNSTNHRYHKFMYSKKVAAGTKVIVPNAYDGDVFHTVITYDTYEELKPVVTLEKLTITPPAKLSYYEGEELDLTGLEVNAVYSDDTTEVVTDYEVSTCDMSVGTHEITISYEGKTATFTITVEEEPVTLFGLTSLTVDGEAVAGFDTLTTEYNVTISANQKNFPAVDYVATEGATVTVEDPTEFPGSAVITVSKDGVEDVVYTLTYVTDKDRVTNVTVLGDNKIPATYGGGNVSAKPKYRMGGFVTGTPAYSDREDRVEGGARYSVLEITDDRLVGGDYITGGITWYNGTTPTVKAFTAEEDLDWLQFTVNRDATVYVLKSTTNFEDRLLSRGFTKSVSSDSLGYMHTLLNGSEHRYHKFMYSKTFEAGTKVVIPNGKDTNNIYHTVIAFGSYEELEEDVPEVTLTGIEIASEPTKVAYIEGEELDLTGLAVKALYSDNSSKLVTDYEVSDCDMSVGTHTITISYEGYTAEFEITVEAEEVAELVYNIDYTANVYANLAPDAKTALPYLNENIQVGSPAYFCRDGVNDSRKSFITAVHEDYAGLSYMGMGIAWKNSPPYRDYYATKPDKWFKFTVGKDVKLTLVTMNKEDSFESALGFAYEAKNGAIKTVLNETTNYTLSHTYTKTFSAGTTIELPSFFNGTAMIILFDENVNE